MRRPGCLDGLAILFATFTQKIALPEQLRAMGTHIPDNGVTGQNPYRLRLTFAGGEIAGVSPREQKAFLILNAANFDQQRI